MKILIAVPTFETIYPDTYQSIYALETGGHETQFAFVRGYDCATARNRIAQKAIDTGADYVLSVDNDVVLPKRVLAEMLEDPQDVTLGWYAHRGADNRYTGRVSVCREYDPKSGTRYQSYPTESEYTAAELAEMRGLGTKKFRIHGGGMGCALIRTDVFKKLKYPWYKWVAYDNDHRGMLSEDLYFCNQCIAEYIPIYSDARAGCGHMFRYVQWPE